MTSRFDPLLTSKQKEAYSHVGWFVRLDDDGSIDEQVRLAVIIAIDTAIENPGQTVFIRDPRQQHPIHMHQVSAIANSLLWFHDMHIDPENPLSPYVRIIQSRQEPVAGIYFVPSGDSSAVDVSDFTTEDTEWLSVVWSLSDAPTETNYGEDEPPLSDDEECF